MLNEMKMLSGYLLLFACENMMEIGEMQSFSSRFGAIGCFFAYITIPKKSFPRWGQETAEDEIVEPPLIYTADSKGPLVHWMTWEGLKRDLALVGGFILRPYMNSAEREFAGLYDFTQNVESNRKFKKFW